MNRSHIIGTTVGASLGILLAAGLAEASPGATAGRQPGRIVIHQDASTLLVLNPDADSLVGNEFVDTWTATRGGAAAGTAATVCQALRENPDHSAVFQCTATVSLAGGQLSAQGTASLGEGGQADFRLAITGGSGVYRLARGDVLVHWVDDLTRTLTFRLAP